MHTDALLPLLNALKVLTALKWLPACHASLFSCVAALTATWNTDWRAVVTPLSRARPASPTGCACVGDNAYQSQSRVDGHSIGAIFVSPLYN